MFKPGARQCSISSVLLCLVFIFGGWQGRAAIADEVRGANAVSVLSEPIAPAIQRKQQKDKTPVSAEAVRASIQHGVQYLKSQQTEDGSWLRYRSQGDTTVLCTLALLNAEEDPKSPEMRKAIQHILAIPKESLTTYVVSLRIMVLAAADPKGELYRRAVAKDVDWLLEKQVAKNRGKNAGGWSYGKSVHGADASNSQFALLALHEASRMGVKIPQKHWLLALEYWMNCFNARNGGFSYTVGSGEVRGSMTCAGISSLIIIQENLADVGDEFDGDRANCCGNDQQMEPVEKAIAWLARHFSVRANPMGYQRGNRNQLYYLYGMERAGRLAGRRFFGAHDWYRAGVKQLISQQNRRDGNWKTSGHGENNERIATSFALLFLAKGKRPVAIGKYKYGEGQNWNLHPKGVHYLTRRLEEQWNQKLNWQTVASEKATVNDLLEAPVLFISGTDQLPFNQLQKEHLKEYLDNGGFLFAEACQGEGCDGGEFDRAFRSLMKELFPDSELAPLDVAHPIWNAHYPLLPNSERPLLGLQACCRTSVVYCPSNLSCYWSLDRPAIWDVAKPNLLKRVEYCGQLGVNVVTYATGRQLKEKGETPKLLGESVEMLTDRVLVFPKLSHGGGADDAPNAWRNVLRDIAQSGLRIKLEKKMIAPELEQLGDHPFVFLHGRRQFSFTAEQREALKNYLELGGFIFADSICSSEQFTRSFRDELRAILGESLQPIAPDHEIWTDDRFGYVINQVTLRTRDQNAAGGFRESNRRPELEGFQLNGRLAVVFSPNDLSCALENTAVSQCDGYTHDDAIRIGTNVILYSLLSDIAQE
jgi:hypothetical protein